MTVYADTSFLFSYYTSDANSSRADAWRLRHPAPLPVTPLSRLELRNALELAVFRKHLSARDAAETWRLIEGDFRAGFLELVNLPGTSLFHEAEILAAVHTALIGVRSLDILHVAAAQLLMAVDFITFDQKQASLATRVGLKVTVP